MCNHFENYDGKPEDSVCGGEYLLTDSGQSKDGSIVVKQQQIHSPGFPRPVKRIEHCSWLFHADAGKRIKLQFLPPLFSLPRDCTFGFVELKGTLDIGGTGIRICGQGLPEPTTYVSETNRLVVIFRVFQQSPGNRGFQALVSPTTDPATLKRIIGRNITAIQAVAGNNIDDSEGPENANPNKGGALDEG